MEEVQPMQLDSGKIEANDVIQLGDVNVLIKNAGGEPTVFVNRSILLSRNLLWQMTMRSAAAAIVIINAKR